MCKSKIQARVITGSSPTNESSRVRARIQSPVNRQGPRETLVLKQNPGALTAGGGQEVQVYELEQSEGNRPVRRR